MLPLLLPLLLLLLLTPLPVSSLAYRAIKGEGGQSGENSIAGLSWHPRFQPPPPPPSPPPWTRRATFARRCNASFVDCNCHVRWYSKAGKAKDRQVHKGSPLCVP